MWPNFGSLLQHFYERSYHKSNYIRICSKSWFWGRWSWFNVNNLGLTLGMVLTFYSSVAKGLKLKVKKCWGGLEDCFLHFLPPPIRNSIKNDLADFRPVKTIKKEKYNFHYLIACSVELTCSVTVIILENTFGNIKINCFYLRGNKVGEIVLLSLHVCRCWTSAP